MSEKQVKIGPYGKLVGEWSYGDSSRGAGCWYATPENYDAVKAAYDALDGDDLGPDCTRDVIEAGGVFVRD